MLKIVNVSDVRLGMYINEVCGNWLEHPFWRSSFSLTTPKQLKSLQKCGVRQVWIDTAKGLDVENQIETDANPDVQDRDETETTPVAAACATIATPAEENKNLPEEADLSPRDLSPLVPVHEEIERARRVHSKVKTAVANLFHDVRMGKALQLQETHDLVETIIQSLERNSNAFLSLSKFKEKDSHTYLHSVAVSALMIAVGRQFNIEGDELRNLGVAGLLHDVGLMQIPEWLLHKQGELTGQEAEVMQTHPQISWMTVLKDTPDMPKMVLDVCLHHHERVDGTGYPDKVQDGSLSLYAKICAVCDVYDTITSDTCYKKGHSPADAIRKMAAMQPGQFDKAVFHAFVKTVGIYPTGTLVKLMSGRLAVVMDQVNKNLLTPIVQVIFSTKSNEPVFQELVDLSRGRDAIVSVESPHKWGLNLKMITGF